MVYLRSDEEIKKISKSCQIVADTLNMIKEHIKPGTKVAQLDSMAEDFIISRGARPAFKGYMGFPSTLCVSIDSAVVHGIPGNDILQEGQIVGIDCGAELNGYYGDHAITFAVGDISEEKQNLMNVTKESLDKAIQSAIPGNFVGDIGYAVQSYAESKGFSVVRELVGHGIGRDLHEEPQIPNFGTPNTGPIIKEGMCFAIEPMINLGGADVFTKTDGWTVCTKDGLPSAHFEHSITVTKNGAKILTQ